MNDSSTRPLSRSCSQHIRRVLMLILSLLTVLASATEARASSREVAIVLEGHLYRDAGKDHIGPITVRLPGYEWQDADGKWHYELLEGSGTVQAVGPDGSARTTRLNVQVSLNDADILQAQTGAGDRLWAMRGDLYLRAENHALVELEYGMTVRFPAANSVWKPPPVSLELPLGDENAVATRLAEYIEPMQRDGHGGFAITERFSDMWGRPAGDKAYFGYFRLVSISATTTQRSPTQRDADILMGKLLYVRGDYPVAVSPAGDIINPGEYDEQVRLMKDARIVASRLPLSTEARARIDAIAETVGRQTPPATVERACNDALAILRSELLFHLSMPATSALNRGAGLYRTYCAVCHGPEGSGPPTPEMKALDPVPPTFADVEQVEDVSPRRAFNAISFGVLGTSMVGFHQQLGEPERWALAFYVTGLAHRPSAGNGRSPATAYVPLEELADKSNAELLAAMPDAPDATPHATGDATGVAAPLGWLRHQAVQAAGDSPWLALRRAVRLLVRDRDAQAHSALATSWNELRPALAQRDGTLAAHIDERIAKLAQVPGEGAADGDWTALATLLVTDFASAERQSAAPAPVLAAGGERGRRSSRTSFTTWAIVGLGALGLIALVAMAARRRGRRRE